MVSITYSVGGADPDTGDRALVTSVTSGAAGSTCPSGTTNAACALSVTVLVPSLRIVKTASVATTTPGGSVTYTVTVTNNGQTPYPAATFTDSLSGVLTDATFTGSASATTGPRGASSG